MAIISTQLLFSDPHTPTDKWIRIKYVFSSGEEMVLDSVVPNATDVTAWIAARTPELEASAADAEFSRIIGDAP